MGVIYLITNTCNKKKYVGQTRDDPNIRWKRHLWGGDNDDYPLYRAMRKYGKENFTFEIIEEIDNSFLDEREKYWIKKNNTYVPNGYNCTLGGAGNLKYNEEEILNYYFSNRDNASKTARFFGAHPVTILNILRRNNIKPSFTYDHFKKPVIQLDLNGNFVKRYEYSKIASEETGILRDSILNSALSNGTSVGEGFLWIYEEKYDSNKKYGYKNPDWKPVRCIETGQDFKSITEACLWLKDNDSSIKGQVKGMNSNINRAIKNNIKAYGYHWSKI